MRADFSRLTFDARKHYTSVLHQQGRVWLDADWNEDALDREYLLQQETVDIIGRCGVPAPHTGFAISPNPDSQADPLDFRIAGGRGPRGRYYVDGLLCQLDADASYLTQPDFPDPPRVTLPEGEGQLDAIVYLEAWQRLITYLEDPELREIALGGPDTATRLRTIAQVKILPVPPAREGVTCENAARFLPRPGRGTLTTLVPEDQLPPDPCRIPDPGTYTGRENHLYRVEIHSGGDVLGGAGGAFDLELQTAAARGTLTLTLSSALTKAQAQAALLSGVVTLTDERGRSETLPLEDVGGAELTLGRGLPAAFPAGSRVIGGVARFKWSRDNAAFAVQVTGASDRQTLTLASLGRDQVTALRAGDLVEICDDASELGPAHGHLTFLTADPDPDTFTVTLAEALPAGFRLDLLTERHLLLRRWDGAGRAAAAFGLTTTPDMNLGDGVHIQFGGTAMHPGDFWVFAARSADGSVERLTDAPPLGIVRHQCVLAIVRWSMISGWPLDAVFEAFRRLVQQPELLAALRQELDALRRAGQTLLDEQAVVDLGRRVGIDDAIVQRVLRLLSETRPERRLALTVLEDCRRPFDPLTECRCGGECDAVVGPGDSLAAALDKIGPGGGVVCLLPGVHELGDTVTVRQKHGLTIRGAGLASILTAPRALEVLRFEQCDNLTLRDFAVVGGALAAAEPGERTAAPENPAAPPAPEAASRAAAPLQVAGVLTFVDCRVVDMAGCQVACTALEERATHRWCIAFLGPAAAPEPEPQPAPGRGRATRRRTREQPAPAEEAPDPAFAETANLLEAHFRDRLDTMLAANAHLFRPAPAAAEPAAGSVAAPETLESAGTERPALVRAVNLAAGRALPPLDFRLSDCSLFADVEQGGAVVAGTLGVSLTENWVLPLAAADEFGLRVVPGPGQRGQRPWYGLGLVDNDLVEVTANRVVDFIVGVITSDQATQGLFGLAPRPSARLVGNAVLSNDGPALFMTSPGADIRLADNTLVGEPLGGEAAQAIKAGLTRVLGAVAQITAQSAIATGNNFRTGRLGRAQVSFAVGIAAPAIIYNGNQAICDRLPALTNVLLFGSVTRDQGSSITAGGNTCHEPREQELPRTRDELFTRAHEVLSRADVPAPIRHRFLGLEAQPLELEALRTELRRFAALPNLPASARDRILDLTAEPGAGASPVGQIQAQLRDLDTEQHRIVDSFVGGRMAAPALAQEIDRVQRQRQVLEEQLRALEPAAAQERTSLLAAASVTVTGLNLLSYGLRRIGRGSDQGSETGVF